MLLLTRSLIESTIKWRFDFFEACMIVMKGYLIDIEDPDDRNFKKKNINDLKFIYIFRLYPNLVEHRRIFSLI